MLPVLCNFVCGLMCSAICLIFFFFFNDTATTEIYTLSLHDALPISLNFTPVGEPSRATDLAAFRSLMTRLWPNKCGRIDRKSTRLNSSHSQISYAVFCLKKKNKNQLSCYFHLCSFRYIRLLIFDLIT